MHCETLSFDTWLLYILALFAFKKFLSHQSIQHNVSMVTADIFKQTKLHKIFH